LTTLDEIKKSVEGSSQWTKFGSKVGSPFLSIFSKEINDDISKIEYTPGKVYKFIDDEFEYKILVEDKEGKNKFEFYIKPKDLPISKMVKKQNLILGYDSGQFVIGSAIIFILASVILLLPYLFW